MEDYSRKEEGCPQLLDFISRDREWLTERAERRSHGISEEKKLELSLGPPGGEWTNKENTTTTTTISKERERQQQRLLSLGYFPTTPSPQNPVFRPPSPWQQLHSPYLHLQSGQGQITVSKESSQPCSNSNRAGAEQSAAAENKAFSATTAVHNSSNNTAQKRYTLSPTVVSPFWTEYIHPFSLSLHLFVHVSCGPCITLPSFIVISLSGKRIISFHFLKFLEIFHDLVA